MILFAIQLTKGLTAAEREFAMEPHAIMQSSIRASRPEQENKSELQSNFQCLPVRLILNPIEIENTGSDKILNSEQENIFSGSDKTKKN
jgi:hypothetical protein